MFKSTWEVEIMTELSFLENYPFKMSVYTVYTYPFYIFENNEKYVNV